VVDAGDSTEKRVDVKVSALQIAAHDTGIDQAKRVL
jgi:hypothetical protein